MEHFTRQAPQFRWAECRSERDSMKSERRDY